MHKTNPRASNPRVYFLFLFTGLANSPALFAEIRDFAFQLFRLFLFTLGFHAVGIQKLHPFILLVGLGFLFGGSSRSGRSRFSRCSRISRYSRWLAFWRRPACSLFCVVTAHLTAFVLLAIDVFDNSLGVLLRNLKIGNGGQQVDMTNFYVTTNILVEELHQFTRIEAVLLAQIDEEFAIAFGRSERLALFTFTPFFLFRYIRNSD